MFDLQESTYWQTEKGANFPHLGIVDMGKEVTISAFEDLPPKYYYLNSPITDGVNLQVGLSVDIQ